MTHASAAEVHAGAVEPGTVEEREMGAASLPEAELEEENGRRKARPRPCLTCERSQRRTPKYATMTRMSIPAIRLSALSVEGLLLAPLAPLSP